jgi:hypothetical protein
MAAVGANCIVKRQKELEKEKVEADGMLESIVGMTYDYR